MVDNNDLMVTKTLHDRTLMLIPAYHMAYGVEIAYQFRLETLWALYCCCFVMEQLGNVTEGSTAEMQ